MRQVGMTPNNGQLRISSGDIKIRFDDLVQQFGVDARTVQQPRAFLVCYELFAGHLHTGEKFKVREELMEDWKAVLANS